MPRSKPPEPGMLHHYRRMGLRLTGRKRDTWAHDDEKALPSWEEWMIDRGDIQMGKHPILCVNTISGRQRPYFFDENAGGVMPRPESQCI